MIALRKVEPLESFLLREETKTAPVIKYYLTISKISSLVEFNYSDPITHSIQHIYIYIYTYVYNYTLPFDTEAHLLLENNL